VFQSSGDKKKKQKINPSWELVAGFSSWLCIEEAIRWWCSEAAQDWGSQESNS